MDTIDGIFGPLYTLVSYLMRFFHALWTPLFGADSGITWSLSIVGLVILMRIALIPLFVRQIRASRNMALIQPKVRELQKKYGHDRERMGQELMKLYKDSGTNPFASCLPILAQSPFFFALFRVLDGASRGIVRGSGFDQARVDSLREAEFFTAHISDSFIRADTVNVRVVTIVMIVLMTATMFFTQRQLMRKNMPKEALSGSFAQQQKIMLYVLPVIFLVGGINFPIGVLIYWLTTNLWTMGQQFWVIRRNPAPGTEAYEAWEERKRKKAARHGEAASGTTATTTSMDTSATGGANANGTATGAAAPRNRVQPQRQSRRQRKKR